jgi:hypothetical protein
MLKLTKPLLTRAESEAIAVFRLRAMVALLVLRNKAIKPLLAAAQRRRKSRGAQNPRPIDKHYETIRTAMQGVFNELGLAA